MRWALNRYCASDTDHAENLLDRFRERAAEDLQDSGTTFKFLRGSDGEAIRGHLTINHYTAIGWNLPTQAAARRKIKAARTLRRRGRRAFFC